MLKFVHIFKHYHLGLSLIGILVFVIQEIPYMVMPLIQSESNPIMYMQNEIRWIETVQVISGMLSMVLIMLLVRDDVPVFAISTTREIVFFSLMLVMILVNFIGWLFYYTGHQNALLIVVGQFAVITLYYFFFGLWENNYISR